MCVAGRTPQFLFNTSLKDWTEKEQALCLSILLVTVELVDLFEPELVDKNKNYSKKWCKLFKYIWKSWLPTSCRCEIVAEASQFLHCAGPKCQHAMGSKCGHTWKIWAARLGRVAELLGRFLLEAPEVAAFFFGGLDLWWIFKLHINIYIYDSSQLYK